MKKIFTILLTTVCLTSFAQLPNGSHAPNFTGISLEGDTIELYDILGQGKSVIIDVMAVWCPPCWSFHQTGTLEELYELYGPDGTDELVVLMIEADPSTQEAWLRGGGNSIGDWTPGVKYPIINLDVFNNLYNIRYFPTIYHVSPDLTVDEIERVAVEDYINAARNVRQPAGSNDAEIKGDNTPNGGFCIYEPGMYLQNMGSNEMTSAEIAMNIDGQTVQTVEWTGQLNPYGVDYVTFDPISSYDGAVVSFEVQTVNGEADGGSQNNNIEKDLLRPAERQERFYTMTVMTDDYPEETYWRILNENGDVVADGGNIGIFSGSVAPGAYADAGTEYATEVGLDANGCYTLEFYDAAGDGMCCQYGEGFYRFEDGYGNLIRTNAQFGVLDATVMSVEDAVKELNAIMLVDNMPDVPAFCGTLEIAPVVELRNTGTVDMMSATIEIRNGGEVLSTQKWEGDTALSPLESTTFQMAPVALEGTTDVEIEVMMINDSDDYRAPDYGIFEQSYIANTDVTSYVDSLKIELRTDGDGEELYWQISNDLGEIIASGGNENVGPNGGGLGVATTDDPGVYEDRTAYELTVGVPANGCYNIILADDGGNGFDWSRSYFRVSDLESTLIYEIAGTAIDWAREYNPVNLEVVTGVNEITSLTEMSLLPNPSSTSTRLDFSLTQSEQMTINLVNTLGQKVQAIEAGNLAAGNHQYVINTASLEGGVYFIVLQNDAGTQTQKLVVQH